LNILNKYWSGFLQLFFPEICVTCGDKLLNQEKYICLKCLFDLPRTDFHKIQGNRVEQQFWGRVKIEHAASYFYFRKGSRYQKIIHYLKYKGLKELGEEVGKHFGYDLAEAENFSEIDVIIPIPLHPKKLKKRGYNQSEWIAKGLSSGLKKPVDNNNLIRVVETSTQTKKSRFERWKNVEGIFKVQQPDLLKNKHVLLVDDVVTTGSTLEACAVELLKIPEIKISIATLAYADY
jgi:ComF family protein